MKTRRNESKFGIVMPFMLFTVFALCVITVLITGAKIYKSFTARDQIGYDHRTVSQYLTTRIRQSDAEKAYFIGDFHDPVSKPQGDTFYFCEYFGEETYYTRIYCHDGYLYELFSVSNEPFDPRDGEKILPVGNVQFSVADDIVTANIEYADGTHQTLHIYMRSHGEGVK